MYPHALFDLAKKTTLCTLFLTHKIPSHPHGQGICFSFGSSLFSVAMNMHRESINAIEREREQDNKCDVASKQAKLPQHVSHLHWLALFCGPSYRQPQSNTVNNYLSIITFNTKKFLSIN